MKLPLTPSILGVLLMGALLSPAATLTNESFAQCSTGSASATGTSSCSAQDGVRVATAQSTVDHLAFGTVSLATSAAADGGDGKAIVTATAGFSDFFIIHGLPAVDGFLEISAQAFGARDTQLDGAIGLAGFTLDIPYFQQGFFRTAIPYRFGDIAEFSVLLSLSAAAENICPACSVSDSRAASFELEQFRVLDANMREIRGYKFHTLSETQYDFVGGEFADPAGVPEPGTWALSGVGLIAAAYLRHRRN